MAKMALVVREATESLNNYEHSKALEVIENYFWQFCDDYIELVKNRAYGTADSTGPCAEREGREVRSHRAGTGLGCLRTPAGTVPAVRHRRSVELDA